MNGKNILELNGFFNVLLTYFFCSHITPLTVSSNRVNSIKNANGGISLFVQTMVFWQCINSFVFESIYGFLKKNHHWKYIIPTLRPQAFTYLMADLRQDINIVSSFSRCLEHFPEGIALLRHWYIITKMGIRINTNLLFWVNLPKPSWSTSFKEMFN